MGLLDKVFGNSSENEEPQSAADQSPDERKLAAFVKHQVESSRQSGSRIAHEGIWMTNIAYTLGFDGVFFDTTTRQFRTAARGNYSLRRNRTHVNTILPTLNNRLSRLCKNPPRYDVMPNSNENDDKEAARLAVDVIRDVWDRQEIDKKRIRLTQGMQQAGHYYGKISWDDQLGRMMMDPVTGETMYEGDIRFDVVSCFEVFPDPLAKTLDEAQWLVQAKVRKLDYFKTHYPERGALVKEEGAWLLSVQYDIRVQTMSVYGQGQTGSQNTMKDAAIELTYYERRSKKHPNGRMVVVANGVLLEDKELPVGEFPIVKFDDILVEGKYYSESYVTHARPIQDQQNRNLQMRSTWMNRLLAGKYLVPKGSGLMQEALNDQSGEVVEYNAVPGAPAPQALTPPVIPAYAYQEEDRFKEWNNMISGIGEISQGSLPSAGIPAVGMQFLQEQDQTRIGIITDYNEYNWAQVGSLILKYAEKYYTNPRLMRIAGPNGEAKVTSFIGEDLRGHTIAKVIKGSTIPGSKVLQRQEILNLYSQGLLGPAQDPKTAEKVLGLLEYGDIQGAWEKLTADNNQIAKQIKMMEQGIVPEINELDNQPLHIEKKNIYRIGDKFQTLPPQIQQIFTNDINQRIQMLTNIANPGLKSMAMNVQHQIDQVPQAMEEAKDNADASGQLHSIQFQKQGAGI